MVAAFEFYKQVRMAHKEYTKARDFVEDIVLSFDRELKRESDRFESMSSKVEGTYSRADASFRKTDSIEKKITPIETQLSGLSPILPSDDTNNLPEPHRKNTNQHNNPL